MNVFLAQGINGLNYQKENIYRFIKVMISVQIKGAWTITVLQMNKKAKPK